MKKYILLAAALVSLAACNNEDNYIEEPIAAHVSGIIGGNQQSRASEVAWDKDDAIGISMSGRYDNRKYKTVDGNGIFVGTEMYFKNKREESTFTAYYPFAGTEDSIAEVIATTTDSERQTPEEQKKFDFLYAVKEHVTGADPNVVLSFSHMMSKLTFVFRNGNDGTDVSRITSYEIDGLVLSGTFDPATGICRANPDTPASTLIMHPAVTHEKEVSPLLLFPQTVDKVTMTIHDSEEQDYACELNFGPEGLEAGNNYQFTITVNKTGISGATSEIRDWSTKELPTGASSVLPAE